MVKTNWRGEAQQNLLVHVLAKQKGPFLRAKWAEVEDLTTEGAEVLDPTGGIGALDPGDALGVVPAFQEAAHRFGDPLQAELANEAPSTRCLAPSFLG